MIRTLALDAVVQTVPAPAHGVPASTVVALPPSDVDPGVVSESTVYTRATVYTRDTIYAVTVGHVVDLMRIYVNGSLIVRPYDSEVPAL